MNSVELGPQEQSVIAAARNALDPTDVQRARVRRGLDAKLAAGVAAPLLAASTALAATLKVGATVVTVALVGTGVVFVAAPQLLHRAAPPAVLPARPAAKSPAPAPAVAPQAPPAPSGPAVADPRPAVAHPRAAPHRREASPAPSGDLAGELGLLTQANAATKQGDVARADELLRAYDQRYPAGQLAQERAAAGILVQCAAGRVPEARKAARRFLERWPRSPLVARIQSSCAAEDKGP
jgi:TolA-binding protein